MGCSVLCLCCVVVYVVVGLEVGCGLVCVLSGVCCSCCGYC